MQPYFDIAKNESGQQEIVFHAPINYILDMIKGIEMQLTFVSEPYGFNELPEDKEIRLEKKSRLRLMKYMLNDLIETKKLKNALDA